MRTEPRFFNGTESNSFRTKYKFFQKQNRNWVEILKNLFCTSLLLRGHHMTAGGLKLSSCVMLVVYFGDGVYCTVVKFWWNVCSETG